MRLYAVLLVRAVILACFLIGPNVPADTGAAPSAWENYSKELEILKTEKDPDKLQTAILILQSKISGEALQIKYSIQKVPKNPLRNLVLEALKPHTKSENAKLKTAALELEMLIISNEPPGTQPICATIETVSPEKLQANDIRMYQISCVIPNSERSIQFLKSILPVAQISYAEKIQLALAIQTDNTLVADFLLQAAKRLTDENDRKGVFRISSELCKDKGLQFAMKIYPLLKETYYSEFASDCLREMKPEIWTLLKPDLASMNHFQNLHAVRILQTLRPKDSIPAIDDRIAKTTDASELEYLKLLKVQISKIPDPDLERSLLARAQKPKFPKTEFLENGRLVEYYAFTEQMNKVDSYLIPLLKARRAGMFSQICRVYSGMKTRSAAAIELMNEIASEKKYQDIDIFCDKFVKRPIRNNHLKR